MFHHQGKNRTNKENLQIAVVLSFVAGMVNVAGFLAFGKLTTNVTGHFAFFIYDISITKFWEGTVFLVYIFSFLAGSFTSGWLIESAHHHKRMNVYLRPTLLECSLLILVVATSYFSVSVPTNFMACMLLFAMGVQNSFVTKISKSIVRTTHITGLMTDLGIEMSQLLYLKRNNHLVNIKNIKFNIQLRFYIILFFFLGGLSSGFLYFQGMGIYVLLIAVIILLAGLFYDNFRFTYLTRRRKFKYRKRPKRKIYRSRIQRRNILLKLHKKFRHKKFGSQ